jgi:hypothetical protein
MGVADAANCRTFAILSGLQTFSPTKLGQSKDGCVPLEVLYDLRCESKYFDRMVPQTDATFLYDKFNRLRLRNNVTSVWATGRSHNRTMNHLQDQMVSNFVYKTD